MAAGIVSMPRIRIGKIAIQTHIRRSRSRPALSPAPCSQRAQREQSDDSEGVGRQDVEVERRCGALDPIARDHGDQDRAKHHERQDDRKIREEAPQQERRHLDNAAEAVRREEIREVPQVA